MNIGKLTCVVVVGLATLGLETAGAADYFEGQKIYETHCSSCHGSDGESAQPGVPNFADGDGLFKPDGELFKQIRSGSESMPAFRGVIEDSEIRDVIAYVRSLQQ